MSLALVSSLHEQMGEAENTVEKLHFVWFACPLGTGTMLPLVSASLHDLQVSVQNDKEHHWGRPYASFVRGETHATIRSARLCLSFLQQLNPHASYPSHSFSASQCRLWIESSWWPMWRCQQQAKWRGGRGAQIAAAAQVHPLRYPAVMATVVPTVTVRVVMSTAMRGARVMVGLSATGVPRR